MKVSEVFAGLFLKFFSETYFTSLENISTVNFKDHFSLQSDIYRKARPIYPDDLFVYLSSISPSKKLCWDCGTGNGQAAISLAHHFEKVIATDPSEKQIQNSIPHNNIEYRVASAEESGLENSSVDLIAAATAAHWFNHNLFYKEVKRVAKPNALIALWTYSEACINPEINELMEWFMYTFLYDYWPDGRWYVRKNYKTLPFPFKQIQTPEFFCKMSWSKTQWLNYIRSWSSYDNYSRTRNEDPLQFLLPKLNLLWNDPEIKKVVWPIHLKCAVIEKR